MLSLDDAPLPPPKVETGAPHPLVNSNHDLPALSPSSPYKPTMHRTIDDPSLGPDAQSRPIIRVPRPLDLDGSRPLDSSGLPGTPASPLPTTPLSPSMPGSEGKPKKANPLVDLIDTEKTYVDQLTGIIRKVASAWSRANMPPHDLDVMFRAIEGIYKTNRAFLSKLKDLGTNPSSPKALGDLLMRWIDDLETPYIKFCSQYMSGFDSWLIVQQNNNLLALLASFSATHPPPLPPSSPEHPSEPLLWTLDSLFRLPRGRLKYYKKLYGRLLKGTTPGRSDHRLLTGAIDKLDDLLGTLDARAEIQAGLGEDVPPVIVEPPKVETEDEVVIDMAGSATQFKRESESQSARTSDTPSIAAIRGSDSVPLPLAVKSRASGSSSARGSNHSSEERLSRETATTSVGRSSFATMANSVTDLERRLSTARTLDIFSMKPKDVRLQMSPASLPFTREMRISLDVHISLSPRATGEDVIHPRGHIYLLTDLFLICEHMTPSERASQPSDGPDMWLCYPPLAGKHLRAAPIAGSDTSLQVTILKRETLLLQLDSMSLRDRLIAEFKDLNEAGALALAASKNPPPPVPPMNGISRSTPTTPSTESRPSSSSAAPFSPSRTSGILSPRSASPALSSRRISPITDVGSDVTDPRHRLNSMSPPPGQNLAQEMGRINISQDLHMQSVPQKLPFLHEGFSLGGPPRMPSSAETFMSIGPHSQPHPPGFGQSPPPPPRGPPFGAGQIMLTHRNGGMPGGGPLPPPHMRPNLAPNGQPNSNAMAFVTPGSAGPLMNQTTGPPPSQPQPPFPGQGYPNRPHTTDPSLNRAILGQGMLRKSPSGRSLGAQFEGGHAQSFQPPPVPGYPPSPSGHGPMRGAPIQAPPSHTVLPSSAFKASSLGYGGSSPPTSPVPPPATLGPVTSKVSAQMKCKVFLKQQHAQWKSIGVAKLKLYREDPTNVKQLVVEADNKDKSILISTIVLTDGVERVGKTGVAIELSDKGARTGIVYMLQLRNEQAAGGLFDELLWGSDRAAGHH